MPRKIKVAQSKKPVKKNRTASTKKSATRRTKKPATKRTSKPGVRLNLKAVIAFSILILAGCVLALLISGVGIKTEKNPDTNRTKKPAAENVEKNDSTLRDTKTDSKSTVETVQPHVPDSEPELVPDDEANPVFEDEVVDTFGFPHAKNAAKICFVIDDAGGNLENVRRYATLPFPLTIAVMPKLTYTVDSSKLVVQNGKELILHQPMQAHNYPSGATPNPGPGAILPGMDDAKIESTVSENLSEIGAEAKGLNNHEGSLVTESPEMMDSVLSVAKSGGLYFLDSRTTSESAVPSVAEKKGMKYIARFAPFLDNIVDRNEMLAQLKKGLDVANWDGYAVIIGHVDKSVEILPALLSEIYPVLVAKGYTVTVPSRLD